MLIYTVQQQGVLKPSLHLLHSISEASDIAGIETFLDFSGFPSSVPILKYFSSVKISEIQDTNFRISYTMIDDDKII